jgi:hypothetical protein
MENLNALLVLLFGAGGAGMASGIISVVRSLRKGKLEDEDTIIKRLDSANRENNEARQRAEKRADEAEEETARYRKKRDRALEYAARLRVILINNQIEPPPVPEDME